MRSCGARRSGLLANRGRAGRIGLALAAMLCTASLPAYATDITGAGSSFGGAGWGAGGGGGAPGAGVSRTGPTHGGGGG
ncbi:hypothetical protein, partial [Komagataeibacter saccharivorans]|uniref:hypothetical protein n=1 Tax=Komagataeibacter saccharivorans TaxID=265959 RepID=UPI0039ED88BB